MSEEKSWIDNLMEYLKEVLEQKETVTADDFWDRLDKFLQPPVMSRRTVASLFRKAHQQGWCEKTSSTRKCRRRLGHVPVWYSKLWKGESSG